MAADPYPRLLRESLEASKAAGLPFDEAWKAALAEHGRRPDDMCRSDSWPMKFTRDVFGRAYVGATFRNDVTAFMDEPRCFKDVALVRSPLPLPAMCRWGGGCDGAPAPGGRFCPEHLAHLQRIDMSGKDLRAWTGDTEDEDALEAA